MTRQEIVEWGSASEGDRTAITMRPSMASGQELSGAVRAIIDEVNKDGDKALIRLTNKFDNVQLSVLRVSTKGAAYALEDGLRNALLQAIANLKTFHRAQRREPISLEVMPGLVCSRRSVPVSRVGLYVPGGSAPLPSTLLMLAVPAQIAGCQEILVCSPPNRTGRPHPSILAAAELLGLDSVYAIGGAQAVAAMALGSETIPKVHKIFGPGNVYVTEAKAQVAARPQGPAIDMPAGPSEVLVIADDSADPVFVAADLLAQAEHDPLAHCVLVSTSRVLLEKTQKELFSQLGSLKREDIASRSISRCRWIQTDSLSEAMDCSNAYAPEHLIINTRDPERLAQSVVNAGSVFLGQWTPEALGDYASGTNHVLPTSGAARAYSGVALESFQKQISFQQASPEALLAIEETVTCLAKAEGLGAHAASVSRRCDRLRERLTT